MNTASYLSQDTVYFFAICALFPEKLEGVVLDGSQLSDYMLVFDDSHVETLLKYQEDGILCVKVLKGSGDELRFKISNINQEQAKTELVKYLEQYREDELTKRISSYNDSYEDTRELLYAYLRKSRREYPTVNASNVWGYWSGRPFWEAILTADLLDGDIHIKDVSLVHNSTPGAGSLPRAQLKVLKSLNPQGTSDEIPQPTQIKLSRVSFDNWRACIVLSDGSAFLLKNNLSEEFAPYNLLKYLIDHPGERVTLRYAQENIPNCNNIHQLGETLRQCNLNRHLKALLFSKSGNTETQLKDNIQLSRSQLVELGLSESESVGP